MSCHVVGHADQATTAQAAVNGRLDCISKLISSGEWAHRPGLATSMAIGAQSRGFTGLEKNNNGDKPIQAACKLGLLETHQE